MPIDLTLPRAELLSLGVSLLCGAILGIEREYRNKSTGLRTVILISLGATLFTLVSRHGPDTDDRIAANIITGIGFIGAGVIFKDKAGVLGLTTASVIWAAAAIGMTAGIGAHSLALLFTGITLSVLLFLGRLERWVNTLPQKKMYTITFQDAAPLHLAGLNEIIKRQGLRARRLGMTKEDGCVSVSVEVKGRAAAIAALEGILLGMEGVRGFY